MEKALKNTPNADLVPRDALFLLEKMARRRCNKGIASTVGAAASYLSDSTLLWRSTSFGYPGGRIVRNCVFAAWRAAHQSHSGCA